MIHLFLCVAALLTPPPLPADDIRIEILSLLSPNELLVKGIDSIPLTVLVNGMNERRITIHPGEQLVIQNKNDHLDVLIKGTSVPFEAECESVRIARSTMQLVVPGQEKYARQIAAGIEVVPSQTYLKITAFLPVEQAVAEITAAEIGGRDTPLEAMKAQAVCVRSYLLSILAAQTQQGISDTTADMLYRGLDGAFGPDGPISIEQGTQAAQETEGIVLTHKNDLWPAYFHACCGGRTRKASTVFGIQSPPLQYDGDEVDCNFCSGSPHFRWNWRINVNDFSQKMFDAETIQIEIIVDQSSVRISSESWTRDYPLDTFRLRVGRIYGWDALKSNSFEVRRENDEFHFVGKGSGHNVGLCQAGTMEAARRGMDWKEILNFYFPSCQVRKDYQTK